MTYKTKSLIYFSVFIASAIIYYVTDTSLEVKKETYVVKAKKVIDASDTTTTAEIKLEDKE